MNRPPWELSLDEHIYMGTVSDLDFDFGCRYDRRPSIGFAALDELWYEIFIEDMKDLYWEEVFHHLNGRALCFEEVLQLDMEILGDIKMKNDVLQVTGFVNVPWAYTGKVYFKDTLTMRWFVNGRLHREDGPAWISKKGDVMWYVNGFQVDLIEGIGFCFSEVKL